MIKNVSLTGLSGAGKTTTAIELGKLLTEFAVLDTDELIIRETNISIPEIFEKFGEQYFRQKETEIIRTVFKLENQIIALGGGAFENGENQKIIKENSVIIYLKTSPAVVFDRLRNTSDRPLLANNFSVANIEKMLLKRESNYKKSDIIIETDNKTPNEVAQEILRALKNEFNR